MKAQAVDIIRPASIFCSISEFVSLQVPVKDVFQWQFIALRN